jgi:hypothetical protein
MLATWRPAEERGGLRPTSSRGEPQAHPARAATTHRRVCDIFEIVRADHGARLTTADRCRPSPVSRAAAPSTSLLSAMSVWPAAGKLARRPMVSSRPDGGFFFGDCRRQPQTGQKREFGPFLPILARARGTHLNWAVRSFIRVAAVYSVLSGSKLLVSKQNTGKALDGECHGLADAWRAAAAP